MCILYFDCSSGISGNMTLAALTELTGDKQFLINELKKLNLNGYDIDYSSVSKNGIRGTHVEVIIHDDTHNHEYSCDESYDHEHPCNESRDHNHSCDESYDHRHPCNESRDHKHSCDESYNHGHPFNESRDHNHSCDISHGHEYPYDISHAPKPSHEHHRNLNDINTIIDQSSLNLNVKALAKRIFMRVARAEARVHSLPVEQVHFHEVGAIDSIIDIVGTAILIDRLHPEHIYSSIINDGYGFIECAHGTISVPVPATSEIFSEGGVAFRQIDVDTELVTPTGAAIIAELAESYGPMPAIINAKIGWGAGTKDLRIPNILKVTMGEAVTAAPIDEGSPNTDHVLIMETNIDDCSPEILGFTMEQLLSAGALDVYYTPIFMKKNRPAYMLTVICSEDLATTVQNIIFSQTTTIGIRIHASDRTTLKRENVTIDTPYGILSAKKVYYGNSSYIYPEFESAKLLAEKNNIPIKEVYRWNYEQ